MLFSGAKKGPEKRRKPKDQDVNPLPLGLDSVEFLRRAWYAAAAGSINTSTKNCKRKSALS